VGIGALLELGEPEQIGEVLHREGARPSERLRIEPDRSADDRLELVARFVEIVVDDEEVEVVLGAQLLLGDLEAFVDRLGGVGAAAAESLAEDGRVGRGDEDLDRVEFGGANLGGSLNLDLEDYRAAVIETALELRVQRAVVVAAVARELEEVVSVTPLFELLLGEEVVIAAVLLSLARLPRRRGDGEREVGNAFEQLLDQRTLAYP
jgi:hypothetical protein